MSGMQAGDVTKRAQPARPRAPVIRRPRPADGMDLARVTFLAGERVEMATIASRLDVSQATVYRWFGSRERLIERVLDEIAREFLTAARARARDFVASRPSMPL